jgi:hypothetical protein
MARGDGDGLGEAHQGNDERGHEQRGDGSQAEIGHGQRRQSGGDVADHLSACVQLYRCVFDPVHAPGWAFRCLARLQRLLGDEARGRISIHGDLPQPDVAQFLLQCLGLTFCVGGLDAQQFGFVAQCGGLDGTGFFGGRLALADLVAEFLDPDLQPRPCGELLGDLGRSDLREVDLGLALEAQGPAQGRCDDHGGQYSGDLRSESLHADHDQDGAHAESQCAPVEAGQLGQDAPEADHEVPAGVDRNPKELVQLR